MPHSRIEKEERKKEKKQKKKKKKKNLDHITIGVLHINTRFYPMHSKHI